MSTIRAAQLIYTRVEPTYSPQMKGGFQTVYRSELLSLTEVAAIEKRVQCFQPDQPTLVRFQFFTLDSGAIVLTRSVQIDSHSEIVDKDRRRGVFIAHCLVLGKAEFDKVGYNPFAILDHCHFLDNAEDMVRIFGQATGNAPPTMIEVEQPGYHLTSWSGAEALKMVTLAMQGEQLPRSGKTVLLIGGVDDINDTLRMVFFLLPRDNRLACTFDTLIERCPVRQGSYWAVGAATRQSGSSYIMVNAAERRVSTSVEYPADEDLYWTWLKHVSSQADFDSAIVRAYAVQSLANAFARRSHIRRDELDEEACCDFVRLHEQRIMRDLESALAKAVGKGIAVSLIHYLVENTEIPILLDTASSQYIDLAILCPILTDWIIREKPALKDGELRALQGLARQGGDMRLLHLLAVLGEKAGTAVRDEALGGMNAQTFQKAMEQLMDPIEPADFVVPMHLPVLLSDPRLNNMSDEQLINLVKAIAKADAVDQLGSLAHRVRSVAAEPLTELERIMRKCPKGFPEDFRVAVAARREELGHPAGFLGFFRK